ncbi:calcium-activated chloride channel regulator 3A-1-like [Haemaphysalis longicornis]
MMATKHASFYPRLQRTLTEPEKAYVYAWFTQGGRVFKDAVVVAEVTAPEPLDNSTKFRLYDNGRGADKDPDDGKYSGYFSTFSGKGKYLVRVHVQTQNTTRLGFPRRPHAAIGLGLGSSLNAPSGDRDEDVQEPVPVHSLVKQCGFFSVTTDIFYWQLPPAYVSDLRVTATVPKPNGTLLVQLTWTWPGAHMHIGNASGVIIRASEDKDQLLKNFDNQTQITSVVEGNLDPLPPGSKHVVTIALPSTFASLGGDGEYRWSASIAIRVMNSYGLSSTTSWVVDVSHTALGIETWVTATTGAEETVTTETAAPKDKKDSESSAWFPLMCVGIIILLVAAVLLAAYITAIRKGMDAPNELLTGEASKSQEEPLTKTVG